jgi:carbonic anhydrase
MPNGTLIEINVDHNFFRLNSAFNDNTIDLDSPPDVHYFWFRLSGRNIYYSSTKNDVNILGAINIANVQDSTPYNDYSNEATCFNVKDTEYKSWKLCAESIDIRNKWVCKIKEMLMINDDLCLHKVGENQPTIIEKTVTQPIILIPLPSRMCNENWNYLRHGLDWECDCAEGKEQSPINLPPPEKAIHSPIKPLFQYEVVEAKATYTTLDENVKEGEYIKIRNVDHALRIFHKYFGKIVTLDGAVYNAEEIVFHTPAEHTIDGRKFDMEMQVIHYGQTKGDISKQVMLCFLFERKPGIYNKFLDDVDYFNLPNPVTKERNILNSLFIPKVFYTADDDDIPIMRPFDFYTYQGSITSPPCTERTIVYVAAKPLQIGSTALQLFQEALRIPDMITQTGDVIVSDNINGNNRALQAVNGRPIFYYKSCDIIKKKVVQPTGHYEKVIKEATKYFYVNGEQPSGLPGAFVVSKKEAMGQLLA